MATFRPEFIPEISDAQRLGQILAPGDLVRAEGTGLWYTGDGITPGGQLSGPPSQTGMASVLTGVDTYAQDGNTTTPLLSDQVTGLQDAMRVLVTRHYELDGENFFLGDDDTALLPFIIDRRG